MSDLRKSRDQMERLLRENKDAAQRDIPGEQIKNQLPRTTLPPGGPTGTGYPPAPHATDWGDVASTPTTLSGYGITDALANPMTTQDDLIIGGAAGVATRLAKGSDGWVLTVDPVTHHLIWAAPAAPAAHASSHHSGGGDALALGSIAGTIDDTQHGARAGGTLHANVVAAGAAGFMTGADKTKLNGIASGATANTGTVTSVDITVPPLLFSVSGNPITTSGIIVLSPVAQNANLFYGGPATGGPSNPTFRAPVAADIPALDAAKITTGQLALARGGSGADLSATGGANQIVRQNSAGGVFTVSALAAADIPALDTSKLTSGVLPLARGGTGVAAIPAFHVHKNGTNQTGIVTATFTLLTWSTEVVDNNNNFASNKFTPTVAGTYLIVLELTWISAADQAYVVPTIYKNGTMYVQGAGRASGALDQASNVIAVVPMNGSTDYLEAYCYQSSGSNKDVYGGIASTFFSGAWIGP